MEITRTAEVAHWERVRELSYGAMRPVVRMGSAVCAGLALLLVGVWAWESRSHAIVYEAVADGCTAQVAYTLDGDEWTEPRAFAARWSSGEVEVIHGDTAGVSVTAAPQCRSGVRCVLREDGEVVARGRGSAGATCTAWTGR